MLHLFFLGETHAKVAAVDSAAAQLLVKRYACISCHVAERKLVGPAYSEIAKKYKNDVDAKKKLFNKIRNGGAGAWGVVPMPAHPSINDADLNNIVVWILAGAIKVRKNTP